ncbi:hypothetical protein Vretimale_19579 [Volvox reticuliferus]|uniref:Reticulon-like protein n=1 Tax=Volvox reticuliferus TaxID=1737510 RepID=A0A8J4GX15_9CHLO|nr:hypothetical protein Vretifemale_19853 [Volvox reticuliferus]GIM17033.1 hypothetical protein Vretimale_19579 [Volvox reticuliferus]
MSAAVATEKKQVHIPFISKNVEGLILWRNPKQSGFAFAGANLAFLAYVLNPFPATTIICYAVAIASFATFIWASIGHFVSRSGPPVPAMLTRGLSEEEAKRFVDAALPTVNKVLAFLGVLAAGTDFKFSLGMVFGSYALVHLFALISPAVLIYIVVVLAFSAPKVYEMNLEQIERVASLCKTKSSELIAQFKEVVSKIPRASPPKKAQ